MRLAETAQEKARALPPAVAPPCVYADILLKRLRAEAYRVACLEVALDLQAEARGDDLLALARQLLARVVRLEARTL